MKIFKFYLYILSIFITMGTFAILMSETLTSSKMHIWHVFAFEMTAFAIVIFTLVGGLIDSQESNNYV